MQDFLELRIAVGDLVGNRSISDMMKPLTKRAEVELNRKLRTVWQIGTFEPFWDGNEAPLPDDFLQLVNADNRFAVGKDTITRRPYATCAGGLAYYQKLSTITTGAMGTNWLLERFPNAYLYAVTIEAAKHLVKPDIVLGTTPLLRSELQDIKIESDRQQFAHRTVQVQGLTP